MGENIIGFYKDDEGWYHTFTSEEKPKEVVAAVEDVVKQFGEEAVLKDDLRVEVNGIEFWPAVATKAKSVCKEEGVCLAAQDRYTMAVDIQRVMLDKDYLKDVQRVIDQIGPVNVDPGPIRAYAAANGLQFLTSSVDRGPIQDACRVFIALPQHNAFHFQCVYDGNNDALHTIMFMVLVCGGLVGLIHTGRYIYYSLQRFVADRRGKGRERVSELEPRRLREKVDTDVAELGAMSDWVYSSLYDRKEKFEMGANTDLVKTWSGGLK